MSKFQIVKGITDNLTETPYVEGKVYFVYDDIASTDLSIYADIDGARRKITPTTFEEEDPKIHILTLQKNENEELTTGEDESIPSYVNNNELVIVYYMSTPFYLRDFDRGFSFTAIDGSYGLYYNRNWSFHKRESYANLSDIPTNVSQLNNDAGYITEETDPTVPAWAKEATKPIYTAAEVGALPDTTVIPEDKVFIATYGTTTYADTLEAYNAGKLIFAKNTDHLTTLTSYRSGRFIFSGGRDYAESIAFWWLDRSTGWGYSNSPYNAITTVSSIESGDYIPFVDANSLNRLSRSNSLTFGTETNQYLANNGTWQTVPENTSDLTNDSGFQTSTEVNSAIATAIGNINQFNVAIVSTLPTENIDNHTIYFMSNGGSDDNIYDEWMYINDNWEKIGTTSIDLSGYMQTSHPANSITSTDISNWNSKTSNTGTVTSVGLTNTTDGGLTISGSPVTNSGSITVGHSNVLSSAQTTQAVYPIKIDKNGHISAYGSAVTITDEKVKQIPLDGLNSTKGLLFSYSTGSSETTNTIYTSNKIMWSDYTSALFIYNKSDRNKYSILTYSNLSLGNSSTNYTGVLRTADVTANRSYVLPDKNGTVALTSDIPNISETDINNWNAKVSDDKTWNGVTLDKTTGMGSSNIYVPYTTSANASKMNYWTVSEDPTNYAIAKYDDSSYLYSTTPSANDNSTKVATTAYVDAAIPNVSGYISNITYNATNRELKKTINGTTSTIVDFGTAAFKLVTTTVTSNGSSLPTSGAVAEYVDNKIPKVYSSTNTNGYLTMATLPIYDGTVE